MSEIKKIKVAGSEYGIADEINRAELQNLRNAIDSNTEKITAEINRAKIAENEIKSKALNYSTVRTSTKADEVNIGGESVDGNNTMSVNIPAATAEKAGVMMATDKKKLNNLAVEGANVDLNTYYLDGVYFFYSKRLTNVPILNDSVVSARLTVLTAYDGSSPVITQVLNLNNLGGGEGNIYIRSSQNGTWKPWGKLQTNVEVGQITPDGMSNLIDNGIYSGVCVDGTTVETFVLIVINNNAVSIPTGNPQSISQLKYSLGLDGSISVASRKRDQYGWDDWASLDEESLVEEEKSRAKQAEETIKNKAVEADSLNFQTRANEVAFDYKTIEGVGDEITIPAATTNVAGVMTAEDKTELVKASSDISDIRGTVSATFDFTTGSTANWQSRTFAYKFTSGNNYHIKVVSDEVVATTYFSVRTADGTVVKNNILTGKGTREIVYKCEGDGDYLYMTIQSNGVAFAYNVEILNLSEVSLGTIARETADIETRTTDIERMLLELPTIDDFVAGYKISYNGELTNDENYSSTEKYFYIPSNTEVEVKGQGYSGNTFIFIYDTTHKVIERVEGQGNGVDVEHTIKHDYPILIRVCVPTPLLYKFSISYDGESINAEIKELKNEAAGNCIDIQYSLFEIGSIDVSKGYWSYGVSEKRVSTSKGVTYHLFKDSKIIIPDGVSIYLGWRYVDADGNVVYKSKGWINNTYSATEEADYVILLKRDGEEVTLNDKTELLKGLKIINGYAKQIFPTDTYDANTIPALRVINHRGYNTEAPENTKAAFELSRLKGYRYVETDLCFTSDNVPVCLHDSTIDRTSNGTGNINAMTFEVASQYIYSYNDGVLNKDYPNEKLLSFENFIKLCKFRGLRAYVEIKSMNEEQADIAVNVVKSMRMTEFVDWISFDKSALTMIKARLPKARLGLLCNAISESVYDAIEELQSGENKIFLNISTSGISDDTMWKNISEWCLEHAVEIEAWIVTTSGYKRMPYLSGITTDYLRPWDFASTTYNNLFKI